MDVFLFMGTHLPEIQHCIRRLSKDLPSGEPIHVSIPHSFNWIEETEGISIETYDSKSVLWVLDPDQKATRFIILDPLDDLLDQLEHLADNLRKCQIEPVKSVTLVDCAATESSPQLKAWYDACIYYSDIVVLGNRQDASKSFIRDYQKHYERLCYPCLFLLMKGNGIPDKPDEILTPGIRRITQLFDIEKPSEQAPGMVIEASCDLELEEQEIDPFRNPADLDSPANIPDPANWVVKA